MRAILIYQDDENYLARVIGHCGEFAENLTKWHERDYLDLDKDKDKDREIIELYSEMMGSFIP